ncbi:MAG: hypothetical protein HQ578_02490 [Chloroflexi bacterium]|nr:hypothetical protein [Chloroflexota bacterium]
MGKVGRVVSSLMQILETEQKEAKNQVGIMHWLHGYLEEESNNIICGSLDRILSAVKMEAARRTIRSVVVLVSPEERISVGEAYGMGSDSWLERLKSQGFTILTLEQFRTFVQSLKSFVAEGNLILVIEFLRANTKFGSAPVYSPASKLRERGEPSTPSRWKPSDFLPAGPPHPPFPRGLFKD